MQEKDNLVLIILSGIPCSGKSTWAEKMKPVLFEKYGNCPVIVISKDDIRQKIFGKRYKINNQSEKIITDEFYNQLRAAISFQKAIIILDNTHCKEKFLDDYMTIFREKFMSGKLDFHIKFFDVPLWKAQLRNIWRWVISGKYIPYKMMGILYRNYYRIDRTKYKHLISNDF